jgi:hypothetical protein
MEEWKMSDSHPSFHPSIRAGFLLSLPKRVKNFLKHAVLSSVQMLTALMLHSGIDN